MPITYTPQYRVSGTTPWTTLAPGPSLTANVTGLTAGTSYDFQVVASNGVGSTGSNIQTASTQTGQTESTEAFVATVVDTQIVYASLVNRQAATGPFNQFYLHNTGVNNPQIAVTLSGGTLNYQGGLVSALVYHFHTLFQVNTSNNWWYWNTSTSDATPGTQGWARYQINGSVTIAGGSSITVAAGTVTNTAIGTLAIPVFSNAANDTYPGNWGGTFVLGTGGDNVNFFVSGTTLFAATTLSSTARTYSISITPTLSIGGFNIGNSANTATTLSVIVPAITGITLSPPSPSFVTGVASTIGTLAVTMSSGSFTGALTAAPSNFFGTTGANGTSLTTTGTESAGTYLVTATATQAGAAGSPFNASFTVTATSSTQAEAVEGTVISSTGTVLFASTTMGQAQNVNLNQFSLLSTGTNDFHVQVTVGSTTTTTAITNVTQLIYHNHTCFCTSNGATFYWNTNIAYPANNPWTAFSVTSVSLASTTYPSGAAAGTAVSAITVAESGDTFSGGLFGGTLAISDAVTGSGDAANFAISGTNLVVATGKTLSTTGYVYQIVVTATVATTQ